MTKLNLVPVSGTAMLRHSKLHKIDVFRREAHKIQKLYAEKCKKIYISMKINGLGVVFFNK